MWTKAAPTLQNASSDLGELAPSETITTWAGDGALIDYIFESNASQGRAQRALLNGLAAADRSGTGLRAGCRDAAEWASGRLGVSKWKARRMIASGYALEHLPAIGAALESGALSLDKTLELTRLASPESESRLLRWANKVTAATIRERADQAQRPQEDAAKDAEHSCYLRQWSGGDGLHFLEGALPAADGALVAKALERGAARLPDSPEDRGGSAERKQAAALVALASAAVAADPDPERATVVVHVPAATLASGDDMGAHLADGTPLHPDVARRLVCDSRIEIAAYDEDDMRRLAGLRDATREPRAALRRAVLERDGHRCTFPECGSRLGLDVHHTKGWTPTGITDIEELVTACRIHHKLVHEFDWTVSVAPDGPEWRRPDGSPYEPGAPPRDGPGAKTLDLERVPLWTQLLPEVDAVEAARALGDYIEFHRLPTWPSGAPPN